MERAPAAFQSDHALPRAGVSRGRRLHVPYLGTLRPQQLCLRRPRHSIAACRTGALSRCALGKKPAVRPDRCRGSRRGLADGEFSFPAARSVDGAGHHRGFAVCPAGSLHRRQLALACVSPAIRVRSVPPPRLGSQSAGRLPVAVRADGVLAIVFLLARGSGLVWLLPVIFLTLSAIALAAYRVTLERFARLAAEKREVLTTQLCK